MKYLNDIKEGVFLKRPNRFIAHVLIDGEEEIVHVKNTGRCKEILIEGTKVYLEKSNNPNRKTKYSLISAYKGNTLINIDSQIPNAVVYDAVKNNIIKEIKNISKIKREVTYQNSRFDIYYEAENEKGFIEVKGVTLEEDGITMFPDAPTERGTKHVREMIKAVSEGYKGYIFLLIQMNGIKYFTPNKKMDKNFSDALKEASEKGVEILAYDCIVTSETININKSVAVKF